MSTELKTYPRTLFARYHVADVTTVMKGIEESGLSEHFWIENPGKDHQGVVQPNSITIYTDLVSPHARECIAAYNRTTLNHRLGLTVSVKA